MIPTKGKVKSIQKELNVENNVLKVVRRLPEISSTTFCASKIMLLFLLRRFWLCDQTYSLLTLSRSGRADSDDGK